MVCRRLVEGFPHNIISKVNSRTHRTDGYPDDIAFYQLFTSFIYKLLALEVHHPHPDVSGQTDKNGVNEIQIEGT